MEQFSWDWALSDLKSLHRGKVFSVFSCGGGSSMGYKRAGFDVIGNVEIDAKVNACYVENLRPMYNYCEDARVFALREDLPAELYDLDILDGSPPCTTFSMAGLREKSWGKVKKFAEGRASQRLDDLFFVFIDIVKKLKPKVCIAENVDGLVKGNALCYAEQILLAFREAGYSTQVFLLNSRFMDTPQKRKRVFFIANRMKYGPLSLQFNKPSIPFGDIRSRESGKPAGPLYKEILNSLSVKERPRSICEARKDGKSGGFTNPIVWDESVCPTITTRGLFFRGHDKTLFTKSDFIRVATFPRDYNFLSMNSQYICGMCVPPNMMAHIASQVWHQWLKIK